MASAIRVRITLLAIILLAAVGGYLMETRNARHNPRAHLERIPLNVAGMTGQDNRLDDEIQDILRANQTLNRRYRSGEDTYWLFIGYFGQQEFGSQIHSPRHCYPGSGWNVLSMNRCDALSAPAGILEIRKNKERRLVLYRYRTRGGATTSEWRLKFELALASLLGRPLDAAFIRFSTRLGKDEEPAAARSRLEAFARTLEPEIGQGLPF
ncbi:MAG: EpsI family protein [bacterium]|nr:EpsI family protein [bacterium]